MEHAVEDGDFDTDPLGGAEEQQVVPSCLSSATYPGFLVFESACIGIHMGVTGA
jgi:hypothetical protein